ncbi:MAG: MurT ligase domain-containing protein [Actinomycetota bacterium]|nr:MurT ligase domain-containing protein [Actinomycetota bacterium]
MHPSSAATPPFRLARPRPRVNAYQAGVIAAARVAARLSRVVGAGGGTSAPGILIERLAPGFVERRAAAFPSGAVVVSGTNGKTTTTAMIAGILEAEGERVVTNASGANLFRGVAAALATASPDATVGVFEVDEGALARVVRMVRPRVLVLTNVFRDQLDRFGEPETVAGLLREAAQQLPPGTSVVANADDPLLWEALGITPAERIGFGVDAPDGGDRPTIGGDPEICPRCGASLRYERRTFAHLGQARCDGCEWTSGPAALRARVSGAVRLGFMPLDLAGERFVLPLGGLHNAYNAAAAVAAARAMGIPPARSTAALEGFRPRFGRAEELQFGERTLWVVLMKNPAGADAIIQQVAAEPALGAVVVAVSDLAADGRDISWIWDAEFEWLAGLDVPVVAAGRRAPDVAVRLQYAGIEAAAVCVEPAEALAAAAAKSPADRPIATLATYTAMLDIRRAVLGSRAASVADVA